MAVVSPNLHRKHNKAMLGKLEKGDLIKCSRGGYSHWAVYIGEEKVIHFAGDGNKKQNSVRCDSFWKAVKGSKALKNNSKDRKSTPLDENEIVRRAHSKLDEKEYSLCWNNCEHFASWCRYGHGWSEQVNSCWEAILAFVGVGVVAGACAVCAGAVIMIDAKEKDKKKHKRHTS